MKLLNLRCTVGTLAVLFSLFSFTSNAQTVTTFFRNYLANPSGLAFDASGNLYVANSDSNTISKITSNGVISTFVSSGLSAPTALTFDISSGNLYVINEGTGTISKITSSGVVSTFVGTGLNTPTALVCDALGNLFVANQANNTISKVNSKGVVSAFVTSGLSSPSALALDASGNLYVTSGSNIYAVSSSGGISKYTNSLSGPIAFDSAGNLYVADYEFIYKVDSLGSSPFCSSFFVSAIVFDRSGNLYYANAFQNSITKVTSDGSASLFVQEGLEEPSSLAFDASGNLYVGSWGNSTIDHVNSNGVISLFDDWNSPNALAFDKHGNLFVAYIGVISELSKGVVSTFVDLRVLPNPIAMAFDTSGNLFVVNQSANSVSKVTPSGTVSTFASTGLNSPNAIAIDASGNLYVANNGNNTISKITSTGEVTTFVANGIFLPTALAIDASGNLYVANGDDEYVKYGLKNTISKVTKSGVVSTFIGSSAGLSNPDALAFDASNNLYVANSNTNVINKIYLYTLPVTLSSFTATANNKTIETNWQTVTELNTNHFIIQHSTDGSAFTDIGTVKAKGSGANSYEFMDSKPANGINYYRLESVDKDGATSFSKVVSVLLTINDSRLTVFPNPAKSFVTISGNHIASVQVIDNMGRVVKVVELKDATNPILSVNGLAAGVYHLRVQTTDGKVSGASFVIN